MSNQAALPTYPTLGDEVRNINRAKRNAIDTPRIVVVSGAAGQVVFDARPLAGPSAFADQLNSGVYADKRVVSKLLLHNLGTNPIYYALNTAADKTKDGTYHDILAGGSVAKDGLGSQVDLSGDQPLWVTVSGTANDLLAVVIVYTKDTILD